MTYRDINAATKVAKAQGGAQRSKVVVVEYPIVAIRVGKYALNDKENTRLVNVKASHQTLPSETARDRPSNCCFIE